MTKIAAIDKVQASIQKKYGAESIFHLSEIPKYKVISSGSLALDYATGIGGFPSNRIIEIAGVNGGGKTSLALHSMNNYLHDFPDKMAVFIDMEHRLETDWAARFIHDPDERFLVLKPSSAEEAVNMFRDVGESGLVSVQTWDSIGGAPTARGLEKDANIASFGGNSGIISKFAGFATVLGGKFGFSTIGINQIRQDMSGYNRHMTPGGEAWKHACTLRLQVKPGPKGAGEVFQKINGEELKVGYQVFVKVVKNSVGAPGRVASYWFYNVENDLGFGIDQVEEVARLSSLTGVVDKAGSWIKHPLLPGGKVQSNAIYTQFLKDNPAALKDLFAQTMAKMQSGEVNMGDIIPMEDPDEGVEAPQVFAAAQTIQQIREGAK